MVFELCLDGTFQFERLQDGTVDDCNGVVVNDDTWKGGTTATLLLPDLRNTVEQDTGGAVLRTKVVGGTRMTERRSW